MTSRIRQITYPPTANGPRAGNAYANTFIDEVVVSGGAADAGKVVVTNSSGLIDSSLLPPTILITVIWSANPTFDFSQGKIQQITLTGDTTPTFINAIVGNYTLVIRQDSSGGHTWNWPNNYKGGVGAGTVASTATVFNLLYDGAVFYLAGAPIQEQ